MDAHKNKHIYILYTQILILVKNRIEKCKNVYDQAIEKSKFNFVVGYPLWVSIKRYWTGKLALACQNWIYFIRLKENVQKPLKIAEFWNTPF